MHRDSNILQIIGDGLKKIRLPSLRRPACPHEKPDEALVLWGVRFYAYSLITHLNTVVLGLAQLIEASNVATAFIVCRHIFEWTAHACYMSRNLRNYVQRKDWKRAWHLHSLAMQGNRWVKDHGTKYDSQAALDDVPDPLSVANIVASYEQYQRQIHGEGDARDSYGLLSEHSHPNSACFLPYYQYYGLEVRFVAPSSDASLLGEERSLMEIMMFLEELLQLGKIKLLGSKL